MKHITLLLPSGNHGQFSNQFPGERHKVKLIFPAGKKTIQRQFAAPSGSGAHNFRVEVQGPRNRLRLRRHQPEGFRLSRVEMQLSHSLSQSVSLSHTHSLTHSLLLSHSLTLSLTPSLSQTHSLSARSWLFLVLGVVYGVDTT